jgi:hypothetical protein
MNLDTYLWYLSVLRIRGYLFFRGREFQRNFPGRLDSRQIGDMPVSISIPGTKLSAKLSCRVALFSC